MKKPSRTLAETIDLGLCRWPDGGVKDDPAFGCDLKPAPGLPYCADHHQRAYSPRRLHAVTEPKEGPPQREDS